MTQSRFFQISLFFPCVLWVGALIIFSIVYKEGLDFIVKNFTQAYRVLVPYIIFAGLIWKIAHHKRYTVLILLACVVPVLWGFFFTSFYAVLTCIKDHEMDNWYVLCIMGFWATLVAYLVEIIPFLILIIFKNDLKPSAEGQ